MSDVWLSETLNFYTNTSYNHNTSRFIFMRCLWTKLTLSKMHVRFSVCTSQARDNAKSLYEFCTSVRCNDVIRPSSSSGLSQAIRAVLESLSVIRKLIFGALPWRRFTNRLQYISKQAGRVIIALWIWVNFRRQTSAGNAEFFGLTSIKPLC